VANGRSEGRSKRDSGRDPGGFIALPVSVLDCAGYTALSHTARSLLLEVARQCKGDDNGRLLLSRAYLARRNWKSADVIQRAKGELIEGGFIFETVKGYRPNKASWYAVTWRKLDKITGFDPGAENAFVRGAYSRNVLILNEKRLRGYQAENNQKPAKVGASLIPAHGTESPSIAPSRGTESPSSVPSDGAMRGVSGMPPVPSDGHPLEVPSVGVAFGVAPPPPPAEKEDRAVTPATGSASSMAPPSPGIGATYSRQPLCVPPGPVALPKPISHSEPRAAKT
jgi:hypothetical protein